MAAPVAAVVAAVAVVAAAVVVAAVAVVDETIPAVHLTVDLTCVSLLIQLAGSSIFPQPIGM